MTEQLPSGRNNINVVANLFRAHALRICGAFALATFIFVIDTATSINGSASVLYFLVILITSEIRNSLIVKYTSLLCALLTLGSYMMVYQAVHSTVAIVQLGLFLFTNLMTTFLLLRQIRDRQLSEAQAKLLQMTNEAIVLMDATGRIIYWNRGAQQLFGFSPEQVLGRKPDEVTIIEFPISRQHTEGCLQVDGHWQGELRIRTGYGRWIHVLSRWKLERTPSGDTATVTTASFDITSQKLGESAVKESDARYRTIFETLAVGIWEHDIRALRRYLAEMRSKGIDDVREFFEKNPEKVRETMKLVPITDVNRTVLDLVGVSEKADFPVCLDEVLPTDDRSFLDFVASYAQGQKTFQFDAQVLDRNGLRIPVTVAMNVSDDELMADRLHVSVMDIRERVAFQDAIETSRRELENATKAAVVGEVSASIAHEVNQPLTAISAYNNAALRWLKKTPPNIEEAIEAVTQSLCATDNATTVVNRVRMLLGKAKPDTSEVVLDDAINQALRLKGKELASANVRTTLLYDRCKTTILGDRVLLQQAFVNIIGNAIEAMSEVPSTERGLVVRVTSDLQEVVISFEDTGPGIDEEGADRLFKPFATTKSSGMGLGLAMCRSIALAHGGDIHIRNSKCSGAIVEMALLRDVVLAPERANA